MRLATLRALVLAHRWLGLALCLPLLVIVVTGTLLIFRATLWVPPDWRVSTASIAESDAALAVALAAQPDWRYVDVAAPGRAFHQVGLADERVLMLRVGAGAPETPPARLAAGHFLFQGHTRLLVGETGKVVVRIIGPLAVLSVVVGLLIWWPRRRGWRGRDLLPAGATRSRLLKLHLGWGAAAAVLLLPMVVSGTLLAHNPTIRAWLKPLSPLASPLAADLQALRFAGNDLGAALAAGRSVWPDGRLTQVSRAANDAGQLTLKFQLPGERHPNGRSTLTIDLTGGRLSALRDARVGGLPAGYDDLLYALHVGKLGGPAHAWAWLLGGVGLLTLLVSGTLAWLRGRLARGQATGS